MNDLFIENLSHILPIALAEGEVQLTEDQVFSQEHLYGLTLIGLIGMIDPLRAESKPAVQACREAGIRFAMVTVDHPNTAMAIAAELGLVTDPGQVVSGLELKQAASQDELQQLDAQFTNQIVEKLLEMAQDMAKKDGFDIVLERGSGGVIYSADAIDLTDKQIKHLPLKRTVTIEEIGNTAAFLCSDLASGITGETTFVDAGVNIMGMVFEED